MAIPINASYPLLVALCGSLFANPVLGGMHDSPSSPDQGLEQPPRLYSAADEALYQKRFDTLMGGSGVSGDLYDILEAVPGTRAYAPLPMAARPAIPAEALDSARDYAARNNSTALLIWRGGELQMAAYFGDVDASMPLVSRSLAKPVTVLATGRAIALGRIESLDQPAADFITEWRGTEKASILVRYLLDMRSGLLPQMADIAPESILNRAYLHPRHDDIIINDYPLSHAPGTRYEYSNATSDLVAVVIERATDQRYSHWVSTQVLQPLGALGGQVWTNREGGLAHAGCCMLLPAESWLRMAILLLQDGVWEGERLLPAGFVQAVRIPTPQNRHAGMGVYVGEPYVERRGAGNPERFPGQGTYHSEPYLAEDLFLFDGNANQVAYIIPSQQLVIMRLGTAPPREPGWDNAYLPNLILRALLPDLAAR